MSFGNDEISHRASSYEKKPDVSKCLIPLATGNPWPYTEVGSAGRNCITIASDIRPCSVASEVSAATICRIHINSDEILILK